MKLVAKVERILRRWDPIGLRPGECAPEDEYDHLAPPIVSMMARGCSVHQLCHHLEQVRVAHMRTARDPESDRRTAEELMKALEGHPRGQLDRMSIPIRKSAEDASTVTYRFESDFWVQDPVTPTRNKVHATYHGEILVDKVARTCSVTREMPFDNGEVASRALRKVEEHVTQGEYPDRTMYAAG